MSRPFFLTQATLFTIVAQHTDSKMEAQPVAERSLALVTAEQWSLTAAHAVSVFRNGEPDPLCVYRAGVRVFCRCPEA
ncbi:MAG: hypothetical protein ACYCZX_13755 [Rhodospirillaceae bacterium]